MDKKNEPRLRAVLWDMDGVLVDTAQLHYQAWVKALGEEGIPFEYEAFRKTFGMNNTSILTFLLGNPPDMGHLERISNRKESLFRNALPGQVQPLPGVQSWLQRLQDLGFGQAVASSAPLANIEALVNAMSLGSFFSSLVSAYDLPGKPDPAVFIEAARQLGLATQLCVVVEDSVSGVTAARLAGMKCLAVTTTNPKQDLLEADRIVDSLEELQMEDFLVL